jgi:hypothetical protein
MLNQSPTTEGDKRREEYFSIFISELRYCNPAFSLVTFLLIIRYLPYFVDISSCIFIEIIAMTFYGCPALMALWTHLGGSNSLQYFSITIF